MGDTPRPNILFLFPDQLRFDWTSNNQDLPIRTPYLNQLQQEGTTFTKAICASPLCAPSRASLASGKEYNHCPVKDNQDNYPPNEYTFYRQLRESGYHVLGCGKFDLNKGSCTSGQPAWGLDGKRFLNEWGFSNGINNEGKMDGVSSGKNKPHGPYMQYLEEQGLREKHIQDFDLRRSKKGATFPTPLPDVSYCDNWIGQNGLNLINSVPVGESWFLQVNFTGPHAPMDITQNMAELYQNEVFPLPDDDKLPAETHQAIRRNYAAMIENIDRWIGLYLEVLEKRGDLSNTLIVFSSDHGEMLGDHGRWGKGDPYHPSVSVPLVVSGPKVEQQIVSTLPTTILDLTATFLEYANLKIPTEMDSRSLKPLLEAQTNVHRDYVFSGLKKWRLVYDGRYKLINNWQKDYLLFDTETDPNELNDLSLNPKYQDHLNRLNQQLEKHKLNTTL